MTLDRDLRRALARKDPPAGFEARLAQRIAARPRVATAPPFRGARAWLLPLAASAAITLGVGLYVREEGAHRAREAELRAERATRELVLALQIASEQILAVQAKVEEIGR